MTAQRIAGHGSGSKLPHASDMSDYAPIRGATAGDRLLTRSEVEEVFGVPKRFLETAVARGDGPALVRIGRLVRYRAGDVRAWIDAMRVTPSSAA